MKKLFVMVLALFCIQTGVAGEASYQALKSIFGESRPSLTEKDVKDFLQSRRIQCFAMNSKNQSDTLIVNTEKIWPNAQQGPVFPPIEVILLGEIINSSILTKIKYQALATNDGLEVTSLKTIRGSECEEVGDYSYCHSTIVSQLPIKIIFRISEEKYLTYNDVTNNAFGYCWQNSL